MRLIFFSLLLANGVVAVLGLAGVFGVRQVDTALDDQALTHTKGQTVVESVEQQEVVTLCYDNLTTGQANTLKASGLAVMRANNEIHDATLVARSDVYSYWVYFPPKANKSAASKSLKKVKARGIDGYVVQEAGKYQYAISLGLFNKQEQAERLVSKIKTKGLLADIEKRVKKRTPVLRIETDKASKEKVIRLVRSLGYTENLKDKCE